MKKLLHSLAALALVALVVVIPSPASAAVVPPPPGAPPALNVLPSTVIGATSGLAGAGRLEVQMAYLYKFAQTPGFWQALAAHQQGIATPAQTTTVNQVTSGFRLPATKLQQLGRLSGGVLTGVSGYTMGTMIGGGILDIFGFDREGSVCSTVGAGIGQDIVGLLAGVDCTAFNEFAQGYELNTGQVAGVGMAPVCATTGAWAGACVGVRMAHEPYVASGVVYQRYCLTLTGWPSSVTANSTTAIGVLEAGGAFRGATTYAQAFTPQSSYPFFGWNNNLPSACGGTYGKSAPLLVATTTNVIAGIGWSSAFGGTSGTLTPTSANPTRTLKCVIAASNGSTYTKVGAPYTEGDGVMPTPDCPDLPPGVDPLTISIFETVNGQDTELYSEETTPEYQQHQTLYPDCSGGTCMLDLRSDTGISCFQTGAACQGWFSDPNRDTKFNCFYGPHPVALSECYVYGPSWEPQSVPQGTPYGDPQTGFPHTAPPGAPQGTDEGAFSDPVQDPTADRQCFPTGWAVLNPVEWVMKPVQCALEWAFVPRPAVLEETATGITTAWDTKVTGKLATVLAPVVDFPVISGCGGIPVDMAIEWPVHWEVHWNFGAACEGPVSVLAAVVRTIFGGGLVLGGLYAISSYFGYTIGFRGFGKVGDHE